MIADRVSALLPVHAGVDPQHLAEAVTSLLAQSRPVDEVVVVHDGPLTSAHHLVLDRLAPLNVTEVRLAVNQGAGVANQAGLAAATGEWIAKFDSDDICVPDRLQRQFSALERGEADICGSAMLEFEDHPGQPKAIRSCPVSHADIARRMRFNNPFNHPTVVYRRDVAVSAGGYGNLRFMQDYDLFARMHAHGARMMNISEPLVFFRADRSMRRRRRSLRMIRLEWSLQRRLHQYGTIGLIRMITNLVIRVAFRLLPDAGLRLVYGRMLTRPLNTTTSGDDQ